ncbi:hypothetical protein C8T65DRAFT_744679 [Cerioporus squamosus]|nr:hypothetical protein C8T65DRAFT_744679 [Cerioporus squamosus]
MGIMNTSITPPGDSPFAVPTTSRFCRPEMNTPLPRTSLALWSCPQNDERGDYSRDASIRTDPTPFSNLWVGDRTPAHHAPTSYAVLRPPQTCERPPDNLEVVDTHLNFLPLPQTDGLPTVTCDNSHGYTQTGPARTDVRHSLFPPVTLGPLDFWTRYEMVQPQQMTTFGVPALAQNTGAQTSSFGFPLGEGQSAPTGLTNLPMSMASFNTVSPDAGEHTAARRFNASYALGGFHSATSGALQLYSGPQVPSFGQGYYLGPPSSNIASTVIPDTPSPPSSSVPSPPKPSSSSLTSDMLSVGTHAPRPKNPAPSPLTCSVPGCGKKAGRKVDLDRHVQSVHAPRQWICCGFPVDDPACAQLTGDRKVRMFAGVAFVGGCGKKFTRKDTLLRHLAPPKDGKGKTLRGGQKGRGGQQLCVGNANARWQPGFWTRCR